VKKATSNLFDLLYGELISIESTIFGKMCFIFYSIDDVDYNDPKPQIVYYPSTKEVKTLQDVGKDFSSFIPLNREDFIKQFSQWMRSRYSDEISFKGVEYIEFLEVLVC
jgi:hypothetical protein